MLTVYGTDHRPCGTDKLVVDGNVFRTELRLDFLYSKLFRLVDIDHHRHRLSISMLVDACGTDCYCFEISKFEI